jgi:superfamily II DNA or RNA helicase
MKVGSIEAVRARIAQLILGEADDQRIFVGAIELRSHQRSAVLRLRESLREFGGGVLCDPVGTGKTFVALALPLASARLIIVAPAVLRDMWSRALQLADRAADFISFEALSRESLADFNYDFVIVDEAHHARNPATKRYRMLARLVSRAEVVMLTATPIHNQRADLVALIALFLGGRAACLTPAELTRCLIRRDNFQSAIEGMPRAELLSWIRLTDNSRVPELLLSLPPPVPPRDGGDGGALITHSLIRQWASSDAALIGGLRRRILRAESLIAALSDGTWPTGHELLSWISGDDSVQLGFPGILAREFSHPGELLETARRHLEALVEVLASLRDSSADAERASVIRRIRRAHCDRSIVAFSEYADTVSGLFKQLVNDGKVAALTASAGRVAGGTISRSEAIRRFAPIASGNHPPAESHSITLLLTTDLLSEGVNLQDAAVVIHLDLPWTPARMEQRLGRVARVGSRHERVQSYAFRPPISSESVVRIEGTLRKKLKAAGIVVPVPSVFGWNEQAAARTVPERNEVIRSVMIDWLSEPTETESTARLVAGVSSQREGFIAAVEVAGKVRILVSAGGLISEDAEQILDVLQQCRGSQVTLDCAEVQSCERSALSWMEADLALNTSSFSGRQTTSVRALVTKRINRILRGSRTHQRAALTAKADSALAAIEGNLGAYDERRLQQICEQDIDGAQFLDDVIRLIPEHGRQAIATPQILAMIVLIPR